ASRTPAQEATAVDTEAAVVVAPSATDDLPPASPETETPALTAEALTEEATAEPEQTEVVVAGAGQTGTPIASIPTGIPPLEDTVSEPGGLRVPVEALVGGLGVLAVLGYAGLYWRGASKAERYQGGFVISRCPVCRQGRLEIDAKEDHLLGIPRVRRTVRCTECRSTLREVGYRRWRYTIDPAENPSMHQRYNGRVVDEDLLRALPNQPHIQRGPRQPGPPPSFIDDEPQD
ncbi:MAG: hypothetical protein DIU68_017025, partial [Chloroflexota bacterium]